MLTFFYLSVITENVSATSKALVGDKAFTLCLMAIPNLTCFKGFAAVGFVNDIVDITHNICYVDVHDA